MKIQKNMTFELEVWEFLDKLPNASAYVNTLIMEKVTTESNVIPMYKCTTCESVYSERVANCPACSKDKKEATRVMKCLCGANYPTGQIPDHCPKCNRPLPTKYNDPTLWKDK